MKARSHTRVQGRVNDLLGGPQLRRHSWDTVLLVGSNEVLSILQTSTGDEKSPAIEY
jgi:hypothetical protein